MLIAIMHWASENVYYYYIVELLIENGANIHANADEALKSVKERIFDILILSKEKSIV